MTKGVDMRVDGEPSGQRGLGRDVPRARAEGKKVLMVCADFPPVVSPGAIRMWEFCKGLAHVGFQPLVLTERRNKQRAISDWEMVWLPQWIQYRNGVDAAAMGETPEAPDRQSTTSNKKERTRFQRLLNLFVPMEPATTLSLGRLLRKVRALQRDHDIALVFVTSNPLASAVAGWLIKQQTGLPLVVEFRDPWTTNTCRLWPTRLHYLVERWLERKVVAAANAIIMNTPTARRDLLGQYPFLQGTKVHAISHGYDAERFGSVKGSRSSLGQKLVIGHLGSFYLGTQRLGEGVSKVGWLGRLQNAFRYSVVPGERAEVTTSSPENLLRAIAQLLEQEPRLRQRIEARFIGAGCPQLAACAERIGIAENVQVTGRLAPERVAAALGKCDILFLTNPGLAESPFIVTKTVEYLATGRGVLAELPPGDQARIIERARIGWVCEPGDVARLKEVIQGALRDKQEAGIRIHPDWDYIRLFRREEQVKDLVQIFRQVTDGEAPRAVISEPFRGQGAGLGATPLYRTREA